MLIIIKNTLIKYNFAIINWDILSLTVLTASHTFNIIEIKEQRYISFYCERLI